MRAAASIASRPAVGVTAAAGFCAAGVHCGIRRKRPDLALIVADRPAAAAAVFTRNRVQAAPILESRENLATSGGRARAVVINSGNANACTGAAGRGAARRTAGALARLLGAPREQILVASTGVIGRPLPVARLVAGLPEALAALSPAGGDAAAGAILTTDTCSKESARRVLTPGGAYVVGGMAKGSGMIHPDMATTLAFVTTDAKVAPSRLQAILARAVDRSFNRITVDGDTSTNDMVAVLASGRSGIAVDEDGGRHACSFERALTGVLVDLARAVARDGEGATKLITVQVTGAASEADALQVARTIAGSPLVKTAIHGADANWGRIVAAAGRAGVEVDPERLAVRIGPVQVLSPGYVSHFSEDAARAALSEDEVKVSIALHQGAGEATVWTCDLTRAYVDINASYRS